MPDIWGGRGEELLGRGLITQDQFNRAMGGIQAPLGQTVDPGMTLDSVGAPAVSDTPLEAAQQDALGASPAPNQDPLGISAAYQTANPSIPAMPPQPTTTVGLPPRDAAATEAYGQAYGSPVMNPPEVPQNPPPEAQPSEVVAPEAQAAPPAPAGVIPGAQPDNGLAALLNPYELREQALRDAMKTGEARAAEESAALTNLQSEQNKKMADDAKWADDQKAALDLQMGELKKQSDAITSQKVDPQRYWKNKTTGEKIMAGIALFLGAAGAVKTGENPAAKLILQAIDKDIDEQRAGIRDSKDSLQRNYTLYGDSLNRFKDDRAAREAARISGVQVAQLGLQAMAARYKAPEMKAKAMDLLGQLEAQKQVYVSQLRSQLAQQKMMEGLSRGQDVNVAMLPKDLSEKYVPGYGFAVDHDSAKIVRAKIPEVETTRSTLKTLIDMSKRARSDKVSPADREKADQLRSLLQGVMREDILGPGTVQENERKMMERIIADPMAVFSLGNERVRLETLLERVNFRWNKMLNAANLRTPDQKFGFKAAK